MLSASPPSLTHLIAYARTRRGSDDDSLVRALRRRGLCVTAFDDEKYVLPRWRSTPLRMVRRALRPALVHRLNADLVRTAEALEPDLFFVFKGAAVMAETLDRMRSMGIPSVLHYPDLSFEAFGPYIPDALSRYVRIVTTKPDGADVLADRYGVPRGRVSYLPPGHDPDLHRPVEMEARDREIYGSDVVFVGNRSDRKEALLRTLCEAIPNSQVRIWGEGWKERGSPALDRAIQGVPVYGDEYPRAIQGGSVALGLLDRIEGGRADVITPRSFEIPAMRTFCLHEATDEMARHFDPETEVPTFEGLEGLVSQVRQFLAADPEIRNGFARRAYQRSTSSGYTVNDRAERLIEMMRDVT